MLAIVIGHSQDQQGARAHDGSITEWRLVSEIGRQLEDRPGVRVFRRPDSGSHYARMRELTDRVNSAHPHAVLSLHIDWRSSPHPHLSGSSALHWPGSEGGAALARRASASAASLLGIPDLGVIPQRRSWAEVDMGPDGTPAPGGPTLWVLSETIAPAAILEICNINHRFDLSQIRARIADGTMAYAIEQIAEEYR